MSSQITTTNDELRLVTQTSSTAVLPSQPYEFLSDHVTTVIDTDINPGENVAVALGAFAGTMPGDLFVGVMDTDLSGVTLYLYASAVNQVTAAFFNGTGLNFHANNITVYRMTI